ncbi:MAG: RsmB/NOP family class I SAM-dependent RNA methyltransferase [Gemmobacter sp.]|nr:RsmB/NOP family class I SAM-dependent RNA methyltransferase [Gemmobacter sp.]
MAEALGARRAGVAVLLQVTAGRMLSDVLADANGPLSRLAPDDRARAQRLALSALRRINSLDVLLEKHLRKSPADEVRAILWLASAELVERPADAHGIVNAAVSLTREGKRTAPAAGFVNAVLRKVAGDPGLAALPVQQMPRWLRQPLVHLWGRAVVTGIEAAHLAGAPIDLTVKDPARAEEWSQTLGADLLPTGSLRLRTTVQVTGLPGFATGDWWVQDAAAAIPARMLNATPGESVLDICAAPGGKTLQMAAAGANVTALDISGPRMQRLRDNLTRTGLSANLVTDDALAWQAPAPFDAVLLDAPCSATGTVRRHPDLPFVKDDSDLPNLLTLQCQLIDRAVALTRPGGRITYCTCSLLPAEGEDQLSAALARHPSLTVIPPEGLPDDWITAQGAIRLRPDFWPDSGGMDGFFIVTLRRA